MSLNNEALEIHVWIGTMAILSGLALYQWGGLFAITWKKAHLLFSFR